MSIIDFTELIYDQETGFFYRRKNPTKQIGSINKNGYVVFNYKNNFCYAHRVAFQICYGYLPNMVDHINGIRTDNRICNLRPANSFVNSQNRTAKGFTKPKQTKKWSASITVNRKRIHLGYFHTQEEAHLAYLNAKRVYHPSVPERLFAV